MKKAYTTLFAFLLSLTALSAQDEIAVLTGEIDPQFLSDQGPQEVFVKTLNMQQANDLVLKAIPDDQGKFVVRRNIPFPTDFTIGFRGRQFHFLQAPGDSSHIIFKSDTIPEFSGDRAGWGNISVKYGLFYSEEVNFEEFLNQKRELAEAGDEKAYLSFIEDFEKEELKLYSRFARKYQPSRDFSKWVEADIEWRKVESLREFYNRPGTAMTLENCEGWIREYGINSPYIPNSAFGRHLVMLLNTVQAALYKNLKEDETFTDQKLLEELHDAWGNMFSGYSREAALSRYFYMIAVQADPASVPFLKERYQSYRETYADSPFLATLDAYLKEKAASDPSFEDVLAKHRGNVVVIDCWATWCGPCRVQLPFMHQLKDSLEGKPVDYVYFSFDRDMNKWKQMIKDQGLMGEHYFLGQGKLMQDIQARFQVNGIPRYILIDQEGKVVSANAPRPGTVKDRQWVFNDELLVKIRELLED